MRNGYLEATNITRSVGGQEVVSTMSIDGDPAYYQTASKSFPHRIPPFPPLISLGLTQP